MERIKDLSQVILRPDVVLAEIVELKSKSNIIIPGVDEGSRDALDYLKIVATGEGVKDLEIGDYIIDMTPADIGVYMVNQVKYGLVYRGNIRVAVKKDNFNLNEKDTSSGLTI